MTRSSAASIAAAARTSLSSLRRSPSQASSIAAEPISDDGLATFLPAMSGAEPCCACATACSAPAFSDAASPRLPAISLASSERISPYILVVTTTSNGLASRTKQRRHGVDDALLVRHLRIVLRHRAHAFEKKPVRDAQHIGLVHRRHFLAPLHRQLEGGLRDARRALPRDLAHGEREIGRRHEFAGAVVHIAVGVEAFGVLAHDDEIDGRAAARRKAVTRARRADIGVKVEPLAQFAGRVEPAFGHRRILVVRHRAEQHAVGRLGLVQHRRRERRALALVRRPADRGALEG